MYLRCQIVKFRLKLFLDDEDDDNDGSWLDDDDEDDDDDDDVELDDVLYELV